MEEGRTSALGTDLEVLRAGIRLMALRALGDPDVADEIAQETLARVAIGVASPPANLGAYVAGIARHVIADVARERKRTHQLESTAAESVADSAPNALDAFCTASEHARVREALTLLSPEDQILIRLSFMDGLTPSEIASRDGVPAERIRQRKLRAIQRLRRAFDALEETRHADATATTMHQRAAHTAAQIEEAP